MVPRHLRTRGGEQSTRQSLVFHYRSGRLLPMEWPGRRALRPTCRELWQRLVQQSEILLQAFTRRLSSAEAAQAQNLDESLGLYVDAAAIFRASTAVTSSSCAAPTTPSAIPGTSCARARSTPGTAWIRPARPWLFGASLSSIPSFSIRPHKKLWPALTRAGADFRSDARARRRSGGLLPGFRQRHQMAPRRQQFLRQLLVLHPPHG